MGKSESELRQTIDASARFIALRSFFESYQRLSATDRGLERRLSRHLQRIEQGMERGRKKLENARRPLFRTRIDDDRRLIDEPLSGDLEGTLALLHVDTHDEAYRWAKQYRGDTAREAHRVLLERCQKAPSVSSTRPNRVSEPAPPRAPLFGSVLTAAALTRIGIPEARHRWILRSATDSTAAELGISERDMEALRRIRVGGQQPVRARSYLPSEEARAGIDGIAGDITSLLRGPLSSFLATLSDEQRSLVRRKSDELLIVKGAAGTGKTIVAIHRMRRWLTEPQLFRKPILFTCYNSVLAHSAAQLLSEVFDRPMTEEVVRVTTAFPLLLEICKELEPSWSPNLVANRALLPAIEKARGSVPQPPALRKWRDEDVLQEILDVIFGRVLLRRSQYLDADREGRGAARALSREHDRPAIWRIYESARKTWEKEGIAPWELVPAHLCGLLKRRARREPRYYGIVVDEIQDLPPSVIQALHLLQGEQELTRTVLLGDAAQSVYRSPFRWKHAGVQAKGHVVTLRRCHRSTPSVLKAAVPLIASQAERFGEDLVLPTAEGEPGPPVQLHLASDEESEATWIADRIRHHILDDVHPANIAVLANTRSARALLRKHLERRDIDVESYDGGGAKRPLDLDHPSVKLLSVSSAKGIEFPIVFVAGATERNYPSAAANPEAIDHAKRMLYTAITRAGRLAHISAPQRDATQLLLDLNLEYAT